MNCPNCGTQLPPNARFCNKCGKEMMRPEETRRLDVHTPTKLIDYPEQRPNPYQQQPYAQQQPFAPQPQPQRNIGNNNVTMIIIVALVVVIVACVALVAFKYMGSSKTRTSVIHDTVVVQNTVQTSPAAAPTAARRVASASKYGSTDYSALVTGGYLGYEDVAGRSKTELRLMRNTIFAVHGRKFKDAGLQQYFNQFGWYRPLYNEVSERSLSPVEIANLNLIRSYE